MHPNKRTHNGEPVVVAYRAESAAEATIIRGLLESAGIVSPADTFTDPFPMQEPPAGIQGTEVLVLESAAGDARRIIDDYQKNPGKNAQ
jgi:hypothetical protein